MQWLTDLLENISISRSTTGAIFITSLVLLFGPKLLPEFVAVAPAEWRLIAIATATFSGTLLIFWLASSTWYNGSQLTVRFWKLARRQPLNQNELEIILWLAKSPTIATDIEEFDYDFQPHTQLELMVLLNGLVERELVEYVAVNHLVILTSKGCQFALELQSKERKKVAASPDTPGADTSSNS